ncbi:MAG: aldehyde dehydrogenase family protein [Proteobacteria bacterium]|nr:aldehyde dehydrogenase family protein [Pseudomonadota bacterium]
MTTYPDLKLYIGGAWRKTAEELPVLNPADESVIGAVPVASHADLDDALAAAAEGFKLWSRTSPRERGEIMLKAAALMRQRAEEIAYAITLEHGKPFGQACLEVVRGCEFFEWDAAEGQRTYGRVVPSEPGIRYIVLRQPVGIVAAFSPWNFPMSQPARKIAGALAAGCSIIIKAAEETPAGALHIARALHDAGLPPGVFNLVFGVPARISEYLIPKPQTRLVAFTGSTAVGKLVMQAASQNLVPITLELGGKSPNIFFADVMNEDDAFLDKALEGFAFFALNQGEVCTCPSRALVHESIYDRFMEKAIKRVQAISQDDPLNPSTMLGAQASQEQFDKIMGYLEIGKKEGAKVLTGGDRKTLTGDLKDGYYIQPTVFEGNNKMRIFQEEIFGPVVSVTTFKTLEEALEIANDTVYGLGAGVWSRDTNIAYRAGRGIEAGRVWTNCYHVYPAGAAFGGYKQSGIGRETHKMMLDHYQQTKNLLVSYSPNKVGFF